MARVTMQYRQYPYSFTTKILSNYGVEASTDLSRSRDQENKLRIDERTEVVVSELRDSGDSLNLFRVPEDVRDSKRVLLKIELGD
ncbi:MAG: hypothetical protein GDA56_13865 [Hormoscilla sp. GM7CHS1pb]|nr:hypothetical protein [Hormoscilla sp. GM7CHS1pb]